MTIDQLDEFFERDHEGREYINGWKDIPVESRRASRKDLHAMLLLDSIMPAEEFGEDAVTASQHDQFWIFPDPYELAPLLTEELCMELIRCGVCYQSGEGFYFMT